MRMKRLVLILLAILPMAVCAQTQFGYLSFRKVMEQMPEYAKAKQDLEVLKQKYEQEAVRGEEEFQRKFVEFLQGQKEFPQSIMQKRQLELQNLMDNGVSFRIQVGQLLEQAEKDLLAEVDKKLRNNGFTASASAPARIAVRKAASLKSVDVSPLKSSPVWRISLGRDGSGNSSGTLELSVLSAFRQGDVTPAMVELRRGATKGLDVVCGTNGIWRQIMGKECFVQVCNENPGRSFSLAFYDPKAVEEDLDGDGCYVLKSEAVPYVSYDVGPVATNGVVRTIPVVERRGDQVVANNGMRFETRPDGTVSFFITKASGCFHRPGVLQ